MNRSGVRFYVPAPAPLTLRKDLNRRGDLPKADVARATSSVAGLTARCRFRWSCGFALAQHPRGCAKTVPCTVR